jgi:predicted dithiol-disulfide oxidoreductase (DUF899 family)
MSASESTLSGHRVVSREEWLQARYLDLTPEGRNETGPNHNLSDWVRHHDRYGADGRVDHRTGRFVPANDPDGCCH